MMIFSKRIAFSSFGVGANFMSKRNFSSTLARRKQFLFLATDYANAEAYSRRLSVREEHLAKAKVAKEQGFVITGGAILATPEPNSTEEKMIGSLIIFEAENEEQVRKEIEQDPYVTNKVWEKYEIMPFKIAIK